MQVTILADRVYTGPDEVHVRLPTTATLHASSIGAFGGMTYSYNTGWIAADNLLTPAMVSLNGETLKTGFNYFMWDLPDADLSAGVMYRLALDSSTSSNLNTLGGVALAVTSPA